MLIPAGTKYKLFYDPFFKFDQDWVESDPEGKTFVAKKKEEYMLRRIPKLIKSIRRNGVITPAYLTISPERAWLHPGQTRCRALRQMGRDTIPMLIVDLVGEYEGDEIPAEYAMGLFQDDLSLTIRPDGQLRLATAYPMFRDEEQDEKQSISYSDNSKGPRNVRKN